MIKAKVTGTKEKTIGMGTEEKTKTIGVPVKKKNEKLLESFIKIAAKARIRTIMIFMVIAAIVALANMKGSKSYFMETPIIATVEDFKKIYDNDGGYAALKDAKVYNTHYIITQIKKKNGRKVSEKDVAFFGMVDFDDGLLLVELPYHMYEEDKNTYENVNVQGRLKTSKVGNDAKDYVVKSITKDAAGRDILRSKIPAVYLDVRGEDKGAKRGLFVIAILVFIGGAFFIMKTKKYVKDYTLHPSYKALDGYGRPKEIEQKIETQWANKEKDVIVETKHAVIMKDYVVSVSGHSVTVKQTKDLLWAYHKVLKQKTYFVTTSTVRSIVLKFADNQMIEMVLSKKDGEKEILDMIAAKVPGIILGFTKEAEEAYQAKVKAAASKLSVSKK